MRGKHSKAERTLGRGANFRRRATQGLMGTRGSDPSGRPICTADRWIDRPIPRTDPADQEIARCL